MVRNYFIIQKFKLMVYLIDIGHENRSIYQSMSPDMLLHIDDLLMLNQDVEKSCKAFQC